MDNKARAGRAERALAAYMKADPEAPLQQHVVDFLTDLFHLAAMRVNGGGLKIRDAVRIARMHWSEEQSDV